MKSHSGIKIEKDSVDERLGTFDLDKESFQLIAGPAVPEVCGCITFRSLAILGGSFVLISCKMVRQMRRFVL